MITPRHDKDGFFKYYTADATKVTLKKYLTKMVNTALVQRPVRQSV